MFWREKEQDKETPDDPEKETIDMEEEESIDTSEGGSEDTGFDDEIGDSSLEEGEYDFESSMDDEREDEIEDAAEGKGLRVVIREKNNVELDFNGNKIETEEEEAEPSTGTIRVQNTGSTNRITGIDLELDNISDLESEEEIQKSTHIGVLAPGRNNDFTFDYRFRQEVDPIKVEQEYYDPESGLSPNFLGGAETEFEAKIIVTNTTEDTIYSIKGEKILNELATLTDSEISTGEISQEGNLVTFEIEEIEAGGTAEIVLKLTAGLPSDVPTFEAGDLTVTYEHRDNLTSGLEYKSVDGVSDFRRRIRRRQRETEPSFYDCEIILENRSEFVYDLNQFTVFAGNLESQQMLLDWDGQEASEDEREIVPSEKVAFEFVFESLEGTPSFGDQIEFSVQTQKKIAAETKITIAGKELKFMAIDISKTFLDENDEPTDSMEIPSYVEKSIATQVTLTGIGTYPLEGLVLRDEVPEGFTVKNTSDVIVQRNGQEISPDIYDVRVGASKQYDETETEADTGEEDDVTSDLTDQSENSLIVEFSHLEETDEGGLDENETLTVRYVVIADKLEPRDEPIRVQAHGEGYIYEDEDSRVYAHSGVDTLNLVVVHKRDDVDISKYISARDYEGQDAYRIELEAENYGTSTVNMEIDDLIPVGFELVEGSIETQPEDNVEYREPSTATDGLVHGWTFKGVEPDKRIIASYMLIEVQEDANPRQLQSVYKG